MTISVATLRNPHRLTAAQAGALVRAGLLMRGERDLTDAGRAKLAELEAVEVKRLATRRAKLDTLRVTLPAGDVEALLLWAWGKVRLVHLGLHGSADVAIAPVVKRLAAEYQRVLGPIEEGI